MSRQQTVVIEATDSFELNEVNLLIAVPGDSREPTRDGLIIIDRPSYSTAPSSGRFSHREP